MINEHDAKHFAEEWIAAWNSHDLERILAHWEDECVFTSPLIAKITGDPSCTVHGKQALRAYWKAGLAANPSLHFVLSTVFCGHNSIVLGYQNHRGQSCAEVLFLNEALRAVRGVAHYTTAPAAGR